MNFTIAIHSHNYPIGCVRRENISTTIIPSSSAESVIQYDDLIWTPAILGVDEVMMSSSHETACHVIMYLNLELELALVAIHKCLVLLHDYLGPNSKKL